MTDLSQLIERIEAADGPDREIDALICITLGLSHDNVMVGVDGWCINSATNPNPYRSPVYTASLDAAMTLVPEGWHLGILTDCNEDNHPHCCLTENAEPCRDVVGNGADLPLSVIAAALRALQSGKDEG